MQRRFPMIDFTGIEVGMHEPKFGALMARRSVQTLVDRFVRSGGGIGWARRSRCRRAIRDSRRQTQSGETLAGDRYVCRARPVVAGNLSRRARQEDLRHASGGLLLRQAAGDKHLARCPAGPASLTPANISYGFRPRRWRDEVHADQHGVLVDPDTQDRRPTQAAIDEVIAFRDRRFPGLRGAPLIGAEVCQYENSSNGDFLIDMHPTLSNVLLVGGGSGHGFKHGPEVGRYAAARLFSEDGSEHRFSLATKGETQHREVH